MRHLITGFCGLLLVAVSATAAADDDYSAVEQQIRALAPNAKTVAISETPIDGILMVQVNGDIVYATADGKFLIQGRLVDMETREDLTEAAKAELRKDLMAQIDPSKQITFAPKDPKYDLTVFTDVDCGYCRKLHSQINEYNKEGIAIHYMAFPRAGIGSRSYEKAVSVWCSDNPQEALTQAKLGADPDPAQCDNPVAEQYQLGMELGVTGTPALLTSNGQLIPGYVPPEQLRERLDKMAAADAANAADE
ncbi:MAG: DsbC family protein [Lysobacterales bacterium]|jgi:thiol:disulfide interchange protein DsbC